MTATGDGTPHTESDEGPQPSALVHERLRAPRGDREVLAIPPLQSVGSLLTSIDRAARCQYDVQGRSLCDLSALARHELVACGRQYTTKYRDVPDFQASDSILLAGHQPQLFHPGVWFKNFALSALARAHRAAAVNLVIDTDTLKDTTLRVPGGSVAKPAARLIPFDDASGEVPFARRAIRNRAVFEGFGQKAGQWLRPLVDDPLLDTFWPKVVERSRQTNNLGECLSQARHQLEGEWQNATLEVPQSGVCRFESFHWFAAHILAQLPRFAAIYNDAVIAYRRLHGIRSANHPVPELTSDGDWLEAPFWLACDRRSDRRHLFARRRGDQVVLSDRHDFEAVVPLADDRDGSDAVEALSTLADRGVQLQTRALTTTLFARLFLGDLFIHGIGGGKYDQLTDELIRRFFKLEPPPFMVLSATVYLPVRGPHVTSLGERALREQLRELEFHPERYVNRASLAEEDRRRCDELLAVKQRWIITPQTRENARERCRAIRSANEGLQPLVADKRRQLAALRDAAAAQSRADSILRWREYAFCLYPEQTLRDFFTSQCRQLAASGH